MPSKTNSAKKRLELLEEWKAKKNKEKMLEKLNKKPIFKCYHISPKLRTDVDTANQFIKGKLISKKIGKSHTSINFTELSKAHSKDTALKVKAKTFKLTTKRNPTLKQDIRKPKPPLQIQTKIRKTAVKKELNSPIKDNLTTEKSVLNMKVLSDTPICHKTTEAVQVVKSISKSNTKKPRSNLKVSSKTAIRNGKDNFVQVTKSASKSNLSANKSKLNFEELSKTPINKKPIENVQEAKIGPVLYISPFVTVSRGKDSARKEFTARRSSSARSSAVFESKVPYASPKAGANYFTAKLHMELQRISEICLKWENYLEEPEVPEEARCTINVAIGQSKLLIAKKFKQFERLISQCNEQVFEEKIITCEDLHGFWDMLYMQVEDVDKRFANLDRLKESNWTEMLPVVQKKRKKAPKKQVSKTLAASSQLKDFIKANRNKQKGANSSPNFSIKTPLKTLTSNSRQASSSTRSAKSKVVELARSESKRQSCSPSLAIMKVAQAIKQGNGLTPAKSILKPEGWKSTGKKSVIFRQSPQKLNGLEMKKVRKSLAFGLESKENSIPKDVRRSARLANKSFG